MLFRNFMTLAEKILKYRVHARKNIIEKNLFIFAEPVRVSHPGIEGSRPGSHPWSDWRVAPVRCGSGRKSWTNRKKATFSVEQISFPEPVQVSHPGLWRRQRRGLQAGGGAQWQSSGCVGGEAVHRHMGARVSMMAAPHWKKNKIQIFDCIVLLVDYY